MKLIITLFLAIFSFSISYAQLTERTGKVITADNPDIQYLGRIDYSDRKAPMFGFTGTQIFTDFTGTSVAMIIKPNSGYFMIEIDDEEPFKIQSENDSVVNIKSGLSNGRHSLHITQCDESVLTKFPTFHGLIIEKNAQIQKPELPVRKIEFIGNSITCALGVEDTTARHNGPVLINQNAFYSYALVTARKLNAQGLLVSRSGIGCYRNNGGNKYGDKKVMPYYYERSGYADNCQVWDFSRYTPDVVCINLGTNDTAQEYIISKLTVAMTDFVRTVHRHYPNAKIVLLSGTMRKNKRLADLTSSLDETVSNLKAEGITEVYRLDFTPADGTLGYGTGYHPSFRQHQKMSDELVPLLRKIMNW